MQMPSASIGEFDENDELYPGHRWHAVMHAIVAAARANGLRAMDGPFAAFKDAAGFERSCRIARALGFDGKQCIHPAQLVDGQRDLLPRREEMCARAARRGGLRTGGVGTDGARQPRRPDDRRRQHPAWRGRAWRRADWRQENRMSGRCYEDFEVGASQMLGRTISTITPGSRC